jgi:transcriptional regulator with XRE-family HTH domain
MGNNQGMDKTGIRVLFAKNLKRLRELRNLSQMALSVRSGLTHNFINDIENCNKWISPESLAKLTAALNVEPHQFFLPESRWADPEIYMYLDDMTDSLRQMAGEIKARYLRDTEKQK